MSLLPGRDGQSAATLRGEGRRGVVGTRQPSRLAASATAT